MAVEDFIRSLRLKHASLDEEICKEGARTLPDDAKLVGMKRQKLRIKDTIEDLSRQRAVTG
jgi:hypothetical protein